MLFFLKYKFNTMELTIAAINNIVGSSDMVISSDQAVYNLITNIVYDIDIKRIFHTSAAQWTVCFKTIDNIILSVYCARFIYITSNNLLTDIS